MENYRFELIGKNITFKVDIKEQKDIELVKRILGFVREDLELWDKEE